jgi:hypothetical protein
MPATVIDLDSRRRIWRVGAGHCRACHAEATRMQLASDPSVGIECLECGAYAFDLTTRPLPDKPS